MNCRYVCHYWNKLFKPILYKRIFVKTDEEAKRIRRMLWHGDHQSRNTRTALVHCLHIHYDPRMALSTWTVMLTQFPRLREINFVGVDIPHLPPLFLRYLVRLGKTYTINMHDTRLKSESLDSVPKVHNFFKRMAPLNSFTNSQVAESWYPYWLS